MSPKDELKQILWTRSEGVSKTFDRFATWSITGVAAFAALLTTNLHNTSFLAKGPLKVAFWCLTLSIVAGYVAKYLGAVQAGSGLQARELSQLLSTERAILMFESLDEDPVLIGDEVAEPFIWPWSSIVRSNWSKGASDTLFGAKKMVRRNCYQMVALAVHALFAAASVASMAFAVDGITPQSESREEIAIAPAGAPPLQGIPF